MPGHAKKNIKSPNNHNSELMHLFKDSNNNSNGGNNGNHKNMPLLQQDSSLLYMFKKNNFPALWNWKLNTDKNAIKQTLNHIGKLQDYLQIYLVRLRSCFKYHKGNNYELVKVTETNNWNGSDRKQQIFKLA